MGQASRDPGPPGEGLGGFQVPSRLSTTTLPANLAADTSPGTGPGFGVDAASPRDPATSTNDGALLGQVSGPGAFGRPWISGLDEPGYVSTPSSPSGPAGREGFARAEGGTTDLGFGSAGTDGHESSPGLARIEAILQQVLDELRRKDADYLPIPSHLDYP